MAKKLSDDELDDVSGGAVATRPTTGEIDKDDGCHLDEGTCGSPTGTGPGMADELDRNDP